MSTEIWWSPHHPFKSSLSGESAAQLAAAYTESTGRQWSQPLGYIHALFEVASDLLQRSADPASPQANLESLLATRVDTIVGAVAWGGGPVKNVAKTPLVGGQWRLTPNGRFKYDLLITDNSGANFIPAVARMEPLS